MEKGHSDLEDYWNELNALQERDSSLNGPDDQGRSVTVAVGTSGATAQSAVQLQQPQQTIEGEDEAEWLKDAGLGHLSDTFRQGREIADSDVNASVRLMPEHQIDAVKRRVRLLNQTIKNRYRQQRTRHKKPDIRDVFKDIEVGPSHFYCHTTPTHHSCSDTAPPLLIALTFVLFCCVDRRRAQAPDQEAQPPIHSIQKRKAQQVTTGLVAGNF